MFLLKFLLRLNPVLLKKVLYWYLKAKRMSPVNNEDYLYAEGDIPVLLVAHMDTVFDEPPSVIECDKKSGFIYNPFGGLGGDDRCGIYAILKLLEKHRPHVLFTDGEEIGGVGAYKAVKTLPKPDVKYIIEFDRRGSNDCVFYDCGNQNFMDYVEAFGFETDYGTFTDISILGEEWDIAAVNLSSGYYHEHTKNEYVLFGELEKTIERADNMIKDLKNAPYYDHQTVFYSFFDDYYDIYRGVSYETQPAQKVPIIYEDGPLRIEDKSGPRLLLEMKNNRPSKDNVEGNK